MTDRKKTQFISWQITDQESGAKLLAFLKDKLGPSYSLKSIKRSLDNNQCLINNRVERFGNTTLGKGDIVSFRQHEAPSKQIAFPTVLFEDSHFLCIDKLPGITSEDSQLHKILQGTNPFLELMHRLDRDTSGVLAFAKSPEAAKALLSLFKEREIEKSYLAIVDGIPKKDAGRIENYLGKIHAYEGQSLWGSVSKEKGRLAITEWKIEKKFKQSSLLLCSPLTGRTHQIRVHLSEMGHPILGDSQYGRQFRCGYFSKRCLLHAKCISFLHPFTQKRVIVEAPIPADFQEAIVELQ